MSNKLDAALSFYVEFAPLVVLLFFVVWIGCAKPVAKVEQVEPSNTLNRSDVSGPIKVNGKIPGHTWSTSNASGKAWTIHIGGRRALVDVTGASVEIDGDYIEISPTFAQPVLDDSQRSGYFFPLCGGKVTEDFPAYIQTITSRQSGSSGEGDDDRYFTTRVATVVLEDGVPVALSFTETTYTAGGIERWSFDATGFHGASR